MKLFLCSQGLKNVEVLQGLFAKPLLEVKCGIILNAKGLKSKEERESYKSLVVNELKDFGIITQEIDLRDYTNNKKDLEARLNNLDMIWLAGGNTFKLRETIKKAAFEEILKKALSNGLIYGGDSAGALILGPTLKYLDLVDDPSQVKDVSYEGLNIIDFVPLPHWNNETYRPVLEKIKDSTERNGYKVITFEDNESIVVTNQDVKIVG